MADVLPFWDHYFRTPLILEDGTELPRRAKLNLIGATIVDNDAADRLDVTLDGGASVPPTGTGFRKIVGGVEQAAAEPVDLADANERTGILPAANGGTGLSALGANVAT